MLLAVVVATAPAAAGSASDPRSLLPDLDQALPRKLSVVIDRSRVLLTFSSRVENHGRGPLIVTGRRPSGGAPMDVRQTIQLEDGSSRSRRAPAELEYVTEPTHAH